MILNIDNITAVGLMLSILLGRKWVMWRNTWKICEINKKRDVIYWSLNKCVRKNYVPGAGSVWNQYISNLGKKKVVLRLVHKNMLMQLSCKILSILILAMDRWMWSATCVTSERGRLFCIPCFSQGIDRLTVIILGFLSA